MTRVFWIVLLTLLWPLAQPEAQTPRFVYFAPPLGSGTDADPYRAPCYGVPGAGAIDVRQSLKIDYFICSADRLPADMRNVVQAGASVRDSLNAGQKTALRAILGKTVNATRTDDLLAELLGPHLRPGRDGKLKIWLGESVPIYEQTAWVPFRDYGLVADAANAISEVVEPAVAWATTLATETFDCANSSSLTCVHTWTEFQGTALAIVSNAASHTGATINEARLDSTLATDDMEVQVTMTAFVSASESRCGVFGRKANDATRTFYWAAAANNASAPEWRLSKRIAGTLTGLGTDTTDPATNDVMKLRIDGSSVSLYVNGVLSIAPVTDTDITGNTYAGLVATGNNGSDSCTMDNVIVYDYPIPTTPKGSILWFN